MLGLLCDKGIAMKPPVEPHGLDLLFDCGFIYFVAFGTVYSFLLAVYALIMAARSSNAPGGSVKSVLWRAACLALLFTLLLIVTQLVSQVAAPIWQLAAFNCFFVFAAHALALGGRKSGIPGTSVKPLRSRIVRLGLFLFLLLAVGDFFSVLWGATIWYHVYYSTDYCGMDFLPWFPITQGLIDARFGDQTGMLIGVTLWQLQLLWLLFAICTWGITIGLYNWLKWKVSSVPAVPPAIKTEGQSVSQNGVR